MYCWVLLVPKYFVGKPLGCFTGFVKLEASLICYCFCCCLENNFKICPQEREIEELCMQPLWKVRFGASALEWQRCLWPAPALSWDVYLVQWCSSDVGKEKMGFLSQSPITWKSHQPVKGICLVPCFTAPLAHQGISRSVQSLLLQLVCNCLFPMFLRGSRLSEILQKKVALSS